MASLDSLPADQRAVLQLVLQRGRSYDDIARLLSIDRAAVRQRALTALDALGPDTGVPDEQRALITDYLLGQLSGDAQDEIRARLGHSPSERAWARVIASELGSLASSPLPEIPTDASDDPREPVHHDDAWSEKPSGDEGWGEPDDYERPDDGEPMVVPTVWPEQAAPDPSLAPARAPGAPPLASSPAGPAAQAPPADGGPTPPKRSPRGDRDSDGRSSRRGGLVLIGAVGLVVFVLAVVLIVNGLSGGGSTHSSSSASLSASASRTSSTTASSTTSATSSSAAKVVAQINLTPPTSGSKAAGIAEVLKEGATDGIAIVAQNVAPNTTKPPNAYAVWLYNSTSDAHLLGFVNPGVGTNGRLSTAGGLPSNASHYKELVVTVETQANPKTPGSIILQGALTGV
jgi:Sigma-70, region 4